MPRNEPDPRLYPKTLPCVCCIKKREELNTVRYLSSMDPLMMRARGGTKKLFNNGRKRWSWKMNPSGWGGIRERDGFGKFGWLNLSVQPYDQPDPFGFDPIVVVHSSTSSSMGILFTVLIYFGIEWWWWRAISAGKVQRGMIQGER